MCFCGCSLRDASIYEAKADRNVPRFSKFMLRNISSLQSNPSIKSEFRSVLDLGGMAYSLVDYMFGLIFSGVCSFEI